AVLVHAGLEGARSAAAFAASSLPSTMPNLGSFGVRRESGSFTAKAELSLRTPHRRRVQTMEREGAPHCCTRQKAGLRPAVQNGGNFCHTLLTTLSTSSLPVS